MRLYVDNGVIKLNNKSWKTIRILNDELTQVYELKLENNNIVINESNRPERNKEYTDESTGVNYFLAIRDREPDDTEYEPILYLDSFDCVDLCDITHENNDLLKSINMLLENMTLDNESEDQLEVTENGWKLI